MADLKACVDQLCDVAKQLGEDTIIKPALFLRQRIYNPDFYVVFLGETCCGKSTVINSLVHQGILPVRSIPSTGAIIEVFLDYQAKSTTYAAIYRDAKMRILDDEEFCKIAVTPDKSVARLRVTLPTDMLNIAGIRIFDTPGYDSLIAEHEEILTDFLPECDSVVYMVNYRTGFQQSDYNFLKVLKDLSRPGIPFSLVISRTPSNIREDDKRIMEIQRNVSALLTDQDLPVFIIPSVKLQNGLISSVELDSLLDSIVNDINSGKRQEELNKAFESHLKDLASMIKSEIEKRLCKVQSSIDDQIFMKTKVESIKETFNYAIDKILKPGFLEISDHLPIIIHQCRIEMEDSISEEIDKQPVANKNETVVYTKSHLLPFQSQKKSEDIQHYLTGELDHLNQQLNDYLNQEIIKFSQDIQLHFSNVEKAGFDLFKDIAGKSINNGLINFFIQYGGQGGAGAGMANAASHALKEIGNLFNHKFSLATHNALKHFMAKIGLTSVKSLGAAISGIMEVATMALSAATWKSMLKSKVKEGLSQWEDNAEQLIISDLKKLEKENIETFKHERDLLVKNYSIEETPLDDINRLQDLMQKLVNIEKEFSIDE